MKRIFWIIWISITPILVNGQFNTDYFEVLAQVNEKMMNSHFRARITYELLDGTNQKSANKTMQMTIERYKENSYSETSFANSYMNKDYNLVMYKTDKIIIVNPTHKMDLKANALALDFGTYLDSSKKYIQLVTEHLDTAHNLKVYDITLNKTSSEFKRFVLKIDLSTKEIRELALYFNNNPGQAYGMNGSGNQTNSPKGLVLKIKISPFEILSPSDLKLFYAEDIIMKTKSKLKLTPKYASYQLQDYVSR